MWVLGIVLSTEDDLKSLMGRCTGSAWQALKALEADPRFSAVVAVLIKRPGTILEYDVERALADVNTNLKAASARERDGRTH